MRNLNLDQLMTLSKVIELAGFSAAARALNLTQPAVSMQVRELESRLGLQLIQRAGKKIMGTAAGIELVKHAYRLQRESDTALAAMRRYREGWLGRVRIGASTTALIYHLPTALQTLRRDHPQIEIVVKTGTTVALVESLFVHDIDLAVATLPAASPGLEITPLFTEQLVAIFPASLQRIPAVATPARMAQLPLILEAPPAQLRKMIDGWFQGAGMAPQPAMELDNLEAIKSSVAAGLAASIVPAAVVADGNARSAIVTRALEPALSRTIGMLTIRNMPSDPAVAHARAALFGLGAAVAPWAAPIHDDARPDQAG
jgi:DNA-binding transcriptional LysR family regulator